MGEWASVWHTICNALSYQARRGVQVRSGTGGHVIETDPDRGRTTYVYNGFDKLIKQTAAVGNPDHDLRCPEPAHDPPGQCLGRQ